MHLRCLSSAVGTVVPCKLRPLVLSRSASLPSPSREDDDGLESSPSGLRCIADSMRFKAGLDTVACACTASRAAFNASASKAPGSPPLESAAAGTPRLGRPSCRSAVTRGPPPPPPPSRSRLGVSDVCVKRFPPMKTPRVESSRLNLPLFLPLLERARAPLPFGLAILGVWGVCLWVLVFLPGSFVLPALRGDPSLLCVLMLLLAVVLMLLVSPSCMCIYKQAVGGRTSEHRKPFGSNVRSHKTTAWRGERKYRYKYSPAKINSTQTKHSVDKTGQDTAASYVSLQISTNNDGR